MAFSPGCSLNFEMRLPLTAPGLRALLDHSVPRGLRTLLAGVEIKHAFEMGWHELRNGDLLRAAERDRFDVLITSDKSIRRQNRLGGMSSSLGTKHSPTLQQHAETVLSPRPI